MFDLDQIAIELEIIIYRIDLLSFKLLFQISLHQFFYIEYE